MPLQTSEEQQGEYCDYDRRGLELLRPNLGPPFWR
jgi:hypothetical protein